MHIFSILPNFYALYYHFLGYSTSCPNDAALYELPEWNACMIWTLNNGNRVVLQNFVYSHNDCTPEKLSYWANYIKKVWKESGTAKCCYEVKYSTECPRQIFEKRIGYNLENMYFLFHVGDAKLGCWNRNICR